MHVCERYRERKKEMYNIFIYIHIYIIYIERGLRKRREGVVRRWDRGELVVSHYLLQ